MLHAVMASRSKPTRRPKLQPRPTLFPAILPTLLPKLLNRTTLSITAALIVVGLVKLATTYHWPIPFLPSPSIPPVINSQTVPELKDILDSPDQNIRLQAGRRLTERVGVEATLEILENSSMPHTGEGHLVVHQVGFYAYQKYGLDGILKCKDYFLYACYHGVIIEAATDQGVDAISQMADKCKGSPLRYFQCAHATGHAILALLGYNNLPEALTTCDQVFEPQTDFPNALSSCHNGAFMENLFGVHEWGTDQAASRQWIKSDDPYFPCTAFEEKYQKGCWLNQAALIYQIEGGDIVKTAEACSQIGNPQYTEWCMDNLARQIHPLTAGDINQVFSLCQQLGPYWSEKCVVTNAGSYFSVGDPQTAITICNQPLSPPAQADCFHTLFDQITPDPTLSPSQKQELCQLMTPPFSQDCLSLIRS